MVDEPRTLGGRSLRHKASKAPDGNRWNDCHYMNQLRRRARRKTGKRVDSGSYTQDNVRNNDCYF